MCLPNPRTSHCISQSTFRKPKRTEYTIIDPAKIVAEIVLIKEMIGKKVMVKKMITPGIHRKIKGEMSCFMSQNTIIRIL